MKTTVLKCATCDGSGKWQAPAVAGIDAHYKRQAFDCLSCEGTGSVTREVETTKDRIERMSGGLRR